jgi:hypothetical protein
MAYDRAAIMRDAHKRFRDGKRLGWAQIDCIYVDLDDLHAELAEIDENLIRSPLTPAQEASAIFRRKKIYVELHKEAGHGGNKTGPSAQFAHTDVESFSENTANATGKHRATVDRAAARGEALCDDLAAIAGTSLDKGVELDALGA